jgi:hypothetical protein
MGVVARIFGKKGRKRSHLAAGFAAAMIGVCGPAAAQTLPDPQPPQAQVQQVAPKLTDEQLLDLTQRQTLKYFIEFAHPVSGMARERTNNIADYGQDIVATGGTGFGVMAMVTGASRGWISRDDARARVGKIVDFLSTKATTYDGLFPHYLDGTTGKVYSLNKADNGSDVVESAFLFQGLLTAREYFNGADPAEASLRAKINKLWDAADWTSHVQPGTPGLTWNHSPDYGWKINLPVQGWNEALIAYVMAASSPTHPISRETYERGWARSGKIKKNAKEDGVDLSAGGGPLFFPPSSFLGLDPQGLKDKYIDYDAQTRNQALAAHAYAVRNPKGCAGYGPAWGLTASDGPDGYVVEEPGKEDRCVIAPTGALASFPYTPDYSMQALRHYYEDYNGKLWGEYGFVDAFSEKRDWQAKTDLAIDEGPIVAMIENYRSGLLWKLFMNAPEVQTGLKKLGFESPWLAKDTPPTPKPPTPPSL